MIIRVFFITLIFSLAAITILLFIKQKRRNDQLSGKVGEEKVSEFLNRIKKDDEVVINNYLASRNKQKTYSIQIDHIFISHKGIFVIETKDFHGVIYGNRFLINWKQIIGQREHKIYNPIKQNATHSKYLFEKLNKKYYCYNIVIFTSGKINKISCCEGNIFTLDSFYSWYSRLEEKRYLSVQEIQYIQRRINYLQSANPITSNEHIQNIKSNHY